VVHSNGQLLSEYVKSHPQVLGEELTARFGGHALPFLLKILSVKKALSIQAHPDKILAEKLHRERPDVYKDPNHKPEMTIAITPFEVLCGFRHLPQIENFLQTVPELKQVVGGDVAEVKSEADLKRLFAKLMLADEDRVKSCVAQLAARLENAAEKTPLEEAILRIHAKYPGDVGNFCPYLLNHFVLAPGEAVFLGPNEPHAYLSGNCVECMATSGIGGKNCFFLFFFLFFRFF
jgi:mannose-6-phosphate isomerase